MLAGTARRIQRVIEARHADDEDALARDEPPLASERLEERSDGSLTLRLKARWRDGTTHILMERSDLIERLVPLIPPPRAHQVRYHGVLAPSASMRDRIVPQQTARSSGDASTERLPGSRAQMTGGSRMDHNLSSPSDERRRPTGGEEPDTTGTSGQPRTEPNVAAPDPRFRQQAGRIRWAALLQRVLEVDALRFPRCGSTMRLLAAIEDPDVAHRILECLALPARAPPLSEVAGPQGEAARLEDDWYLDQSAGDDEP